MIRARKSSRDASCRSVTPASASSGWTEPGCAPFYFWRKLWRKTRIKQKSRQIGTQNLEAVYRKDSMRTTANVTHQTSKVWVKKSKSMSVGKTGSYGYISIQVNCQKKRSRIRRHDELFSNLMVWGTKRNERKLQKLTLAWVVVLIDAYGTQASLIHHTDHRYGQLLHKLSFLLSQVIADGNPWFIRRRDGLLEDSAEPNGRHRRR